MAYPSGPHPEPSRHSRRRLAAAPHGEGTHFARPTHPQSVTRSPSDAGSTAYKIVELSDPPHLLRRGQDGRGEGILGELAHILQSEAGRFGQSQVVLVDVAAEKAGDGGRCG